MPSRNFLSLRLFQAASFLGLFTDLITARPATQLHKLLAPDAAYGDSFGVSVSINGNLALVGAHEVDDEENGDDSGSAYLRRQSTAN